jgi:threonine/homoserine/homoserine lactone efflux protein
MSPPYKKPPVTLLDALTLFSVVLILAAIPSTSVALVVMRSANAGLTNGLAVSAGIVCGDLVFIFLAMLGLSAVAEGSAFLLIKYLGGAYLIYFGFTLLSRRSQAVVPAIRTNLMSDLISDFMLGLLLTLGDIKAIFFYLALLPLFLDMSNLTPGDVVLVAIISSLAVGSAKVTYAFSASKLIQSPAGSRYAHGARQVAGGLMVVAGVYLIIRE